MWPFYCHSYEKYRYKSTFAYFPAITLINSYLITANNFIYLAEKEFEKDYEALFKQCRRNKVSQSLLLLSKASFLALSSGKISCEDSANLVKRAYDKLVTAEEEDKSLFENHVKQDSNVTSINKTPPAPIVCLRTFTKIVLQPRKFEPVDSQQPSWYRVFASQMTNVNSKARISDFTFPGCGDQVSPLISITG